MKTRKFACGAIVAGVLAAFGASGAEPALELEDNYPLESAQRLKIGLDGSASVKAVIGVLVGAAIGDVDLYRFHAEAGDVLTIDIDGGKNMGARSVDTFVTVLGPSRTSDYLFEVLAANDDSTQFPIDDGSVHRYDPYIPVFKVHKSGTYYVGVTGYPRRLANGGAIIEGRTVNENGDYTLIISGATPELQQITIEIKPGSGTVAPVNPKARGSVPVALLSSNTFDPFMVEPSSLTFGSTGDEKSWQRCAKDGDDLNGDGKPDLVCHFENQKAAFDPSDLMATLRGKTKGGIRFEGHGLLKVVPKKRTDD